jgi:hypothetical protein
MNWKSDGSSIEAADCRDQHHLLGSFCPIIFRNFRAFSSTLVDNLPMNVQTINLDLSPTEFYNILPFVVLDPPQEVRILQDTLMSHLVRQRMGLCLYLLHHI